MYKDLVNQLREVADMIEALAYCKNQRCRRLFYVNRKGQIYCSHKCAVSQSVRNYRTRQVA